MKTLIQIYTTLRSGPRKIAETGVTLAVFFGGILMLDAIAPQASAAELTNKVYSAFVETPAFVRLTNGTETVWQHLANTNANTLVLSNKNTSVNCRITVIRKMDLHTWVATNTAVIPTTNHTTQYEFNIDNLGTGWTIGQWISFTGHYY